MVANPNLLKKPSNERQGSQKWITITIALLPAQAKNFTSITAASRGGQEKTVTIETNVCRHALVWEHIQDTHKHIHISTITG